MESSRYIFDENSSAKGCPKRVYDKNTITPILIKDTMKDLSLSHRRPLTVPVYANHRFHPLMSTLLRVFRPRTFDLEPTYFTTRLTEKMENWNEPPLFSARMALASDYKRLEN